MTDAASPTPFAPLLPASPPASSPAASAAPADSTGAGLAARLDEIEIRLSYFEDLLDTLNTTVFRQQQQIDLLQEQLRMLRQQFNETTPGEPLSLRDELPPHY